jgi:hypothetical protein
MAPAAKARLAARHGQTERRARPFRAGVQSGTRNTTERLLVAAVAGVWGDRRDDLQYLSPTVRPK